MRFCSCCGQQLVPGAAFCHHCGDKLKTLVPLTEETPVSTAPASKLPAREALVQEESPAAAPPPVEKESPEEKAFLDQTHRVLRWERKAASIVGKFFLIFGSIFSGLFFLIGTIITASGMESIQDYGTLIIAFLYAFFLGGSLVAVGIISLSVANRIPMYMDSLYRDFSMTNTRCSSVGTIVFGYFFNQVALVFYIINFVRMKSNKVLIQHILDRQKAKP